MQVGSDCVLHPNCKFQSFSVLDNPLNVKKCRLITFFFVSDPIVLLQHNYPKKRADVCFVKGKTVSVCMSTPAIEADIFLHDFIWFLIGFYLINLISSWPIDWFWQKEGIYAAKMLFLIFPWFSVSFFFIWLIFWELDLHEMDNRTALWI